MPRRAALLALALAALTPTLAQAADPAPDVTIQRTAHGIPHITAKSFHSLGYGPGHAMQHDNPCVLAEVYATVDAERARWFGPEGRYALRGNGSTANNRNSDFFYDARTILTYSQSTDPTSPHHADQTRLYAKKEWVDLPFCRSEIEADPALRTQLLGKAKRKAVTKVKARRVGRRAVVSFRLARPAPATLTAVRGGKVVARVSRKRLKPGTRTLAVRLPKGAKLRLSVTPFGEARALRTDLVR